VTTQKAAEDLRSAAGATADGISGGVWAFDAPSAHFQDDDEQYVREKPPKAVFAALGIVCASFS